MGGSILSRETQMEIIEEVIVKGWEETKIANSFTSNFQVVAMEVNALIILFTSF